jgi:hypothetical protein
MMRHNTTSRRFTVAECTKVVLGKPHTFRVRPGMVPACTCGWSATWPYRTRGSACAAWENHCEDVLFGYPVRVIVLEDRQAAHDVSHRLATFYGSARCRVHPRRSTWWEVTADVDAPEPVATTAL